MASIKYLSEFYSFKTYIQASRTVDDLSAPLEKQIQSHVLLGNQPTRQGSIPPR
jgi:hypothetical protein